MQNKDALTALHSSTICTLSFSLLSFTGPSSTFHFSLSLSLQWLLQAQPSSLWCSLHCLWATPWRSLRLNRRHCLRPDRHRLQLLLRRPPLHRRLRWNLPPALLRRPLSLQRVLLRWSLLLHLKRLRRRRTAPFWTDFLPPRPWWLASAPSFWLCRRVNLIFRFCSERVSWVVIFRFNFYLFILVLVSVALFKLET